MAPYASRPLVVIPSPSQPLNPQSPPSIGADSDTESLTDAQISSLLAAAENRLQQKQQISRNNAEINKLPRLDPGEIVEPYVRNEGGVAKIDKRRILGKEEREGVGGARVVERREGKGKGKKVSLQSLFLILIGRKMRCFQLLVFHVNAFECSRSSCKHYC